MEIPGYTVGDPVGFGASGHAVLVYGEDGRPYVAVRVDGDVPASYIETSRTFTTPLLPHVIDVVMLDSERFVIMEPVVGPSLATVVRARGGQLCEEEIHGLWRSLSDALAILHRRGIIHGDISPTNILLSDAGPVLIDVWGHGGSERAHNGYVSPECVEGGCSSQAADIWALARILLWASNGHDGIAAQLSDFLHEDPDKRPTARDLWARSLEFPAPLPVDIPSSARLVQTQLRAGHEPTLIARMPAKGRKSSKRILATLLAATACAAAAIWVVVFHQNRDSEENIDPIAIATELIALRDEALVALNDEGLSALFEPGPSLDTDLRLLSDVLDSGGEISGYRTEIAQMAVQEQTENAFVVEAEIYPSAYTMSTPEGTHTVDAGERRCICIAAHAVDNQWLLTSITDCEAVL